ncbi:MAG: DUF3782 domain-containing protein [Treponema sp.]|nr:DUF3782 domain-containing protein [Treponema sp.]
MAQTSSIPGKTRIPAPEEIWAILEETAKLQNELRESMKETDKRMKETDKRMKDTDKQMKETDKKIGELGNRFGELAEHLVTPSINEKFNEMGFSFDTTSQNQKITDSTGRTIAEIDILLEDGDVVIAVEVKTKPLQKDVDEHIKRMEVLRRRADARSDKRKFRGAIAGAIMTSSTRDYAHKNGFYVIEQTGDTVRINIPPRFKPREW